MINSPKILLVVSNYNEENAILDTIADIQNNSTIKADLLIIDNSSTDKSQQLIKESGVDYLFHPVNTGGSAGVIKTAFIYAQYRNYDIYCHMDGDNQHIASELEKIIKPLLEDRNIDVVTGSRFIDIQGFQSSFLRRQGIILFSNLLSLVTKSEFTDITSGFRAYNRRAILYFATSFKQEIETIIQMELMIYYASLKSIDVSIQMRPRLTGKSEINFKNALKFPILNLISFIGTIIQKHR